MKQGQGMQALEWHDMLIHKKVRKKTHFHMKTGLFVYRWGR